MKELVIAGLGVGFGCFCIWQGHNTVVIASVFALLGGLVGFGVGKTKGS